ncbi:MAG: S-layer homology domain-containing protein [Chloroflexia bacterium]
MKHRTLPFFALFALLAAALLATWPGGATPLRASAAAAPKAGSQLPAGLLPGDLANAVAAGNQQNSQVAAGNGMYLVVWEDSRTNFQGVQSNQLPTGGEPGGQNLKDVYALRLDANGQPLDATPIVVAEATWDQFSPQVAWNGQNWLVVWNTQRVAGLTSTVDVMAARVSPEGVVLDPNGIVVDNSPTVDELYPVVASDGSNWAVVWFDQESYFELRAARVAPNGTVMDPSGVPVYAPQFPHAPYNPTIAFAGDEYLLAWADNNDIKGERLSTALAPMGGLITISAQIGNENMPDVASNGTDFFVAWQDGRDLQTVEVFGARVAHAGQVLDPAGIDISAGNGGFPSPDVIWDGTQWFVTWEANNSSVYAARVASTGTVLDPGGRSVVAGTGSVPAIGSLGTGGALVTWTDLRAGGFTPYDVYSAPISAAGTVGTASPISMGAPSQRQPDLAPNGTGYLSVFVSEVSGETRIKGQRLDANGNALDQEPFLIQGGARNLRDPRVAWNGTLYLVVWENSAGLNSTIAGKRVAADGTVLDPSPISIMPGNDPDVDAVGGTFLVAGTHEPVLHTRYPKAVRVDAAGVVQGTPVIIGSSFAVNIKVAAFGTRWLVVWQHHPTHDNPRSSAYAALVNLDGSAAPEFLVAGDGVLSVKTPNVAASAAQGLIVYFRTQSGNAQSGDLFARRILPDGTLLDSNPGIQVTSAPEAQFLPSVAWDGAEYVVAYEDYRNVAFLDRPRSDIYGTRVDSAGVVLDPNGFAVANNPVPEIQPAVASNPGSYLIGYADFRDTAPYTAYRIDVLYGQAGGQPTPQPTNTPGLTITPTATDTPTALATRTPTQVPTSIATTSQTTTPAVTATATAQPCAITFTDVLPTDYFYQPVTYLYCRGAISGYADNTFRPYNNTTRGQLTKIVVLAEGWPIYTPASPTFLDVPTTDPFYQYIETAYNRNIISGYDCGAGCLEFRPGNNVTRGQLTKIVVLAQNWEITPPTTPTFRDVPTTDAFYGYIETAYSHNIISGYECGAGCLEFRPGNNATRGQIAKIVYLAVTQP